MDGEGIYFFGEDKKIYPHSPLFIQSENESAEEKIKLLPIPAKAGISPLCAVGAYSRRRRWSWEIPAFAGMGVVFFVVFFASFPYSRTSPPLPFPRRRESPCGWGRASNARTAPIYCWGGAGVARWYREIPAFAGMGSSFNFGGSGGMDGEGICFFGEDKKIYPHSREGGNLPVAGAGRATLALHLIRGGRCPLVSGDSRLRGNGKGGEWGCFLLLPIPAKAGISPLCAVGACSRRRRWSWEIPAFAGMGGKGRRRESPCSGGWASNARTAPISREWKGGGGRLFSLSKVNETLRVNSH